MGGLPNLVLLGGDAFFAALVAEAPVVRVVLCRPIGTVRRGCINLDAFAVMYDGTYNRTSEAIELQLEHLQMHEVAELLGQFTCKTRGKCQ